MSLAVAAFVALLAVGFHTVTWVLVTGAAVATLVSRLLYHGRSDSELERKKSNE
jgi:hypothetical protein